LVALCSRRDLSPCDNRKNEANPYDSFNACVFFELRDRQISDVREENNYLERVQHQMQRTA
jgi:hypothetical protein